MASQNGSFQRVLISAGVYVAHLGYFHLERDGSADILEPLAAEVARVSLWRVSTAASPASTNLLVLLMSLASFAARSALGGVISVSRQAAGKRPGNERNKTHGQPRG